ncbi:MAG: rRNA maturation RNase YbeY [Phycisphaeraceae bacterium]|nr:rRNA maturation RNase YbeY [Phycisphaeraceae bacterium]MCW5761880.1 rRNA maturation RNase YbeY [Phycisphaeraceae bacterium]
MDESSDEPPQRMCRSGVIEFLDPDRLLDDQASHWIRQSASLAEKAMSLYGEVRVRLLDDAAMAQAHLRYLDEPGPTDVLTFDMTEPGMGLDVDILVCVDEARRQAAVLGHETAQEILLYVIHGVLHCLGYDDHDEASARAMHAEEDRVLEAIGVGAVYAPGSTTADSIERDSI